EKLDIGMPQIQGQGQEQKLLTSHGLFKYLQSPSTKRLRILRAEGIWLNVEEFQNTSLPENTYLPYQPIVWPCHESLKELSIGIHHSQRSFTRHQSQAIFQHFSQLKQLIKLEFSFSCLPIDLNAGLYHLKNLT